MEKESESPGSGCGDVVGVGSIVWVRRRNGSWWPGKILEPEELSVSHLMSPRSGTPVKLLGREDASVDWYNLEKSKRVKAFRCGEFNDCIERAESSQGVPVKKREKYARREDAILHALELEKELLKKEEKLGMTSDPASSNSSDAVKKEVATSPENDKGKLEKLGMASDLASSNSSGAVKKEVATSSENDKGELENSKSANILDLSHKDEIGETPLHSEKAKEENQPSLEDNKSEVKPRMRVLQDFGRRTAPSKRKFLSSVVSNGSQTPIVDENSEVPHSGVLSIGDATHLNGKVSLDKRKRVHEELAEKALVRKRERRRPLVQVLQSSARLEVSDCQPDCGTVSTSISGAEQMGVICQGKRSKCVYLPDESGDSLDCKEISPSQVDMSSLQFEDGTNRPHVGSFNEQSTFGFGEDFESESSETDSSEPDSDSSETEPDMHTDMALLSDPWAMERSEAIGGHGSMSSEEADESAHSADMPHFYPHDPVSANEAVSKWQLKGKRNVRNLSKRSADTTTDGTYSGGKESSLRHRAFGQSPSFHRNGDYGNGFDDTYLNEKELGNQMVEIDNGEYSLASRSTPKRQRSLGMHHWEDLGWEDVPSINEYWGDRRNHFDPFYSLHPPGGWARSTLVDVDLKVQASYQKECVPIVSLMSKVNGQAIIGHPIQIEALEECASETLLSTNEDLGNKTIDNDAALQPSWRTARRTAKFRVPRPHLSSALANDEAGEDLPRSDKVARPPLKKLIADGLGQKASLTKKSLPHVPRPPTVRKFPRKSPKKVSLSSNQKTRTLSSIAIEQNLSNPVMHDSNNCQIDGLIKSESSGPTTVACIPIKLVFSRLLEKINRPPSKPGSNNAALPNSEV